jgi:hypothetical protein
MVDIAHMDEHVAVGFVGRVLIISYRLLTSLALRLADERASAYHKQIGGQSLCTISMLDVRMEFPDQATRDLASELGRNAAVRQLALASVLFGSGFRASAARAASAGIMLLSRSRVPQRTFSTVEEAANWFGGLLSLSREDEKNLVAAVNDLRERHLAYPGR